jgi:hypothetical protein
MFMSRPLEKTPKTKMRRQPEESLTKKKSKTKLKTADRQPGFDMWEDETPDGC